MLTPQNAYAHAVVHTAKELELPHYLASYDITFMTFPAAPHMDMYIHIHKNPKKSELTFAAPFFKLAPADIALLATDPAKQQRYTELVRSALLPARHTSRPHANILQHLVYSTIHHMVSIITLTSLHWWHPGGA